MAHAVATRGYSATSVANVIELAGVSRTTFYEHFANKEDCFLAAYEVMAYRMMRNVRGAQQRAEGSQAALSAAFQALTREVMLEPSAARMVIVESAKAGASARRARALVEAMLRQIPLGSSVGPATAAALTRGVFGGVRDVLYRALCEERTSELPAICGELHAWTATYVESTDPPAVADIEAALTLRLNNRLGLAVDNSGGRSRITAPRSHSRIAGFSTDGQTDAERHVGSHQPSFARVDEIPSSTAVRAHSSGVDWPSDLQERLGVLIDFVAAHPNYGRLGFLEVCSARDAASARTRVVLGDLLAVLSRGNELTESHHSPIVCQAIAAAIWENVHHEAAAGPIRLLHGLLDQLSYIALAPFIGSEQAARFLQRAQSSQPDLEPAFP